MGAIRDFAVNAWSFITQQLKGATFWDALDILIVAVILYVAMKFLRDRRAAKLALGIGLMFLLWAVSVWAKLVAVEFIMTHVFQIGLIALVIIFQPELRSALEKMGTSSIRGIRAVTEQREESRVTAINAVCEAAVALAKEKTGALIVLERTTRLGDIMRSGTCINADISSSLLRNIFFNKAPLHDGAVVISEGRIRSAGCLLPLSQNPEIVSDLGTRHRAAIGMSENSDAAVIVVSEETGTISLALEGRLRRNFDYGLLRRELEKLFPGEQTIGGKQIRIFRHRRADGKDTEQQNREGQ